jgi:periplasmic divalent cation tolerance protein
MGACVVLVACPDETRAKELARSLVEQRLIACAQRFPITSTYRWKGEVQDESEWLLMMKTTEEAYSSVESYVKLHHPYEIPEIIRVPVETGLPAYLDWIRNEVTS